MAIKTLNMAMFSKMGNRLVTGAVSKTIKHSQKKGVREHINRDKIISEYMTALMKAISAKGHEEVFDTAVRECIYWHLEREIEWEIELELH
jgi:hypothetical protein